MVEVRCAGCGEAFEAQRRNAKWCSARCRKQGSRAADQVSVVVTHPSADVRTDWAKDPADTPFVAKVRETLGNAGRLDSFIGLMAIELAKAAQSPKDTGSAKAALMKQLRDVMAEALRGTGVQLDAIDELEQRRQKKVAGLA